jgi:UDP-GlcNAc:undecaprenyl-phosphate/decaprenyl-phosphate GlcNAc-1-phosphate transferase
VRYYLLVIGTVAVVTCVLGFIVLRLTHRFKLYPTKIRARDVHTRPTPRLGGVAMFIGVIAGFVLASQLHFANFSVVFNEAPQFGGVSLKITGLLLAALLIVVMGVADDIWDLDWWTKLAGQIIAGGILAYSGLQIVSLPILGGVTYLPSNISLAITVLAVVLVMNAVNFIDGLDGLVAGVALIASGVFFIYSYWLAVQAHDSDYLGLASLITAALIGACVGFLPLNFYPAKMFMGDAGALLVGLLMAASALSVTGQVDPASYGYGGLAVPAFIPILLPVAILILPLLDFSLAVLRRLRAGKSPFAADRLHLHHRLLDIGHSHLQAVLIFYGWTAVISIGCLGYLFVPWRWATLFIAVGVVVCAFATIVPLLRRHPIDPDVAPASFAHLEIPATETPTPKKQAS